MIAKVAKKAINILFWKRPTNIKNSDIKPLVPGTAILA
jgi:hypothetical protein